MAEEAEEPPSFGLLRPDQLLRAFRNFKKSGAPSRFLLLSDEGWTDLTLEVFEELKAGFQAGKSTLEVPMDGKSYLFDFLSMCRIDPVTAGKNWIGWIDVDGKCHFPGNAVEENVKRSTGRRKLGLRDDKSVYMHSKRHTAQGVKRGYVDIKKEVIGTEVFSAGYGKQRWPCTGMLRYDDDRYQDNREVVPLWN